MNMMSQFDLFELLPSAYKARHSCETALVHVQNNIMRAMDQGKVGILLLLHMSAAFENVEHRTQLNRLHIELGIGVTALDWFESYIDTEQSLLVVKSRLMHVALWSPPPPNDPYAYPRTTAIHCINITPRSVALQ